MSPPDPPRAVGEGFLEKLEKRLLLGELIFAPPVLVRMIIRKADPRAPEESQNGTSWVNIFAPFSVLKKRVRAF